MSDEILKRLLVIVERHWSKPWAMIIALCIALVSVLIFLSTISVERISVGQWSFMGVVTIAVIAIWVVTNRIPRAKKGTIGIGVAIYAENELQAKALQSDFIKQLKDRCHSWLRPSEISFIEFRRGLSESMLKNSNVISKVSTKSRCHIIIYGEAKKREVEGIRHVLELNGLVRHAPIGKNVSQNFSKEFREVLPQRIMFPEDGDVFSFEITAAFVDIVTRYIIGMAAWLSGDLKFAEEVLVNLNDKLAASASPRGMAIDKIRDRIPQRIAGVLLGQLGALYSFYHMKRDRRALVEAEQVLQRFEKLDSNNYKAHLIKAICCFVVHKDLSGARREIRKCEGSTDGTWLWSKAFLEVYELKLDQAFETYKLAFKTNLEDSTVPVQCEEFINCVLEDEPDKGQLYYALGLINYRGKRDHVAAKRDFEAFIAWTKGAPIKYLKQVKWCEEQISRMTTHLISENPV